MPSPVSRMTHLRMAAVAPFAATSNHAVERRALHRAAEQVAEHCSSRFGSPQQASAGATSSVCRWIQRCCAAGRAASTALSTAALKSHTCGRAASVPVTMRLMSSRSSISDASARALRPIASAARCSSAASASVAASRWAQPTIAFSGVRSSWLTLASRSSFQPRAAAPRLRGFSARVAGDRCDAFADTATTASETSRPRRPAGAAERGAPRLAVLAARRSSARSARALKAASHGCRAQPPDQLRSASAAEHRAAAGLT